MIQRYDSTDHEITLSLHSSERIDTSTFYTGLNAFEEHKNVRITNSSCRDKSQTLFYNVRVVINEGNKTLKGTPVKEMQELQDIVPASARTFVRKLDLKRNVSHNRQHHQLYLNQILYTFPRLRQLNFSSENKFTDKPIKDQTYLKSAYVSNEVYYHRVAYYHLLPSSDSQYQENEYPALKKITIQHLFVTADVFDMLFTECPNLTELQVIDCVIQQDVMLNIVSKCEEKNIRLALY